MTQSLRRRGGWVVVACAALSGLVSVSGLAALQQERDAVTDGRDKEVQQAREVQALAKAVYGALRGRLGPVERPFRWSNDFFKGENGNTYVPFTLTIDGTKMPTSAVALYVFVTPRLDRAAKPATSPPRDLEPEDIQAPPPPEAAFEAPYFIAPRTNQASDPYRVSRALSVPPGDYDVYVALAANSARDREPNTNGVTANVMLIKQEVSVPNMWTTGLSTSTVVLAESVAPLIAPLTPDEATSNPYTLGTWRIVPAEDADFQKTDELSVIFFVYNAGLTSERKPDVTVEYLFHRRHDAGETYFSRTPPQDFNGRTMPGFDVDAGHQLVAGQSIPLRTFPEGGYRLEIKVTDKTSGSSVTRHVTFAVR